MGGDLGRRVGVVGRQRCREEGRPEAQAGSEGDGLLRGGLGSAMRLAFEPG